MPGGGTLTISTARVKEAGGAISGPATMSASRSRTGPACLRRSRARDRPLLDQPFGKGTGLGLAQVHGIARQSGGTVRIESREGEGTVVRILLPHVEPAVASAHAEDLAPAEDKARQVIASARIMVVDDDPEVRTFLIELLEQQGHEVEAIDRPEAAIRALDKGVPDLAADRFRHAGHERRAARPGDARTSSSLPIAFVTGYAESENLEGALGRMPVLRKPSASARLPPCSPDRATRRVKRELVGAS